MHSLWFVNQIYETTGNTINGAVVGHFASDRSNFDDGAPSQIHTFETTYFSSPSELWSLKYSMIDNTSEYLNELGELGGQYETSHELQIINNRAYDDKRLETTLTLGKDVFGENYTWLAVNVYW
jgi:hypothetical protein